MYFILFILSYGHHRDLHSFPTRRSSDLSIAKRIGLPQRIVDILEGESLVNDATGLLALEFGVEDIDRKSTRLNSSHRCISYAVFCLKKKKIEKTNHVKNTNQRVDNGDTH